MLLSSRARPPPGGRATAATHPRAPRADAPRAGARAPRPRAPPAPRAAPRDEPTARDPLASAPAGQPRPNTTESSQPNRGAGGPDLYRPPGPEPDAAAFANVVVAVALASAAGWAAGVDPWQLYRGPVLPALAAGVACAPALIGLYYVVRSLTGSIYWAAIEGQGALGTLSPPRAAAWSAAVALADGATIRGFVLAWLSATIARPGGAPAPDPTGWATAADAAVAGAAGTLTPLVALPPAWFAPALALATGAAAAAAACWEPLAPLTAGFASDDGGELNLRELLWAWWDADEEVEADESDPTQKRDLDSFLADAADGNPATLTVRMSAAARRWPHGAGWARSLALPALVLVEATSLTVETLATHSLLASIVTHALALGALCAMEAADKRDGEEGEEREGW